MKWVGWKKGVETLAISFIGCLICNYKICSVLLNHIKMHGVHVYHICVERADFIFEQSLHVGLLEHRFQNSVTLD